MKFRIPGRSSAMRAKNACLIINPRTGENLAKLTDILTVLAAAGWDTREKTKRKHVIESAPRLLTDGGAWYRCSRHGTRLEAPQISYRPSRCRGLSRERTAETALVSRGDTCSRIGWAKRTDVEG